MMKLLDYKWAVLICALSIIISCGSGGGGIVGGGTGTAGNPNNILTVTRATTTGASTATYREGFVNSFGLVDPNLFAASDNISATLVGLSSGIPKFGPPAKLINIIAGGISAGTYTIGGGGSSGTYIAYDDQGQSYMSTYGSGTVTLTSVGNVGAPIIGSFNAVLTLIGSSPTTTLGFSGSFSVVREQ
jgi:hypothetical protein